MLSRTKDFFKGMLALAFWCACVALLLIGIAWCVGGLAHAVVYFFMKGWYAFPH